MAVIKVPKTPRSAFNKDRPLSNLLKAQVGILETLAGADPAPAGAMAMSAPMPRTEGEAAQYMATLAARVYPNVGALPERASAPAAAADAPLPPPAKRKRARSRKGVKRTAVKRKGAKKAAKNAAPRSVARRKRKASGARRGRRGKAMKRRTRR